MTKPLSPKFLFRIWSLCALILYCLPMSSGPTIAAKAPSPRAQAAASRTWSFPSEPVPQRASGVMPDVSHLDWPDMPQRVMDGANTVDEDLRPFIERRIMAILDSRLLPELEEIKAAIKDRQLRVVPQGVPGGAAGMFSVAEENGGLAAYIFVSPFVISSAQTPQEILYIVLTFVHEWGHVKQWVRMGRPRLGNYMGANGRPFTDQECGVTWHAEADMYFEQCKVLYAWGMQREMSSLCEVMGLGSTYTEADPGFNFVLWSTAMTRPLTAHPECGWRLAKEAGHPNPESYRNP